MGVARRGARSAGGDTRTWQRAEASHHEPVEEKSVAGRGGGLGVAASIGWIDGSSSSGDGESSATDAMAGPVLLLVLVSVSCVLARQRMEEPGYCLHQTLTFARTN